MAEKSFKDKFKDPKFVSRIRWIALAIGLILILGKFFTTGLLVLLTVGVAIFSNIMNLKWTGIELATMSTVLFGVAYGPQTGAIMGLVLIILQLLGGLFVNIYNVWVVPGYVLAGVIAGLSSTPDIAGLGMAITIGMHIAFSIFTAIFTPGALAFYAPYAVGNIIFNFIAFSMLAPRFLNLMI